MMDFTYCNVLIDFFDVCSKLSALYIAEAIPMPPSGQFFASVFATDRSAANLGLSPLAP